MFEQLADGLAYFRRATGFAARGFSQSGTYFRLSQMKHQVVSAQAGDIQLGVKARERIVEIVGEKDRLQPALLQYLRGPVGREHFRRRRIVERFPVVGRHAIVGKTEQRAGHLDEPAVLNRVIEWHQVLDQPADFLFRIEPRLFDARLGHAGRVGQLGVVMIAEHIGQRLRGWRVRIDVRMRIDEDQPIQFIE